MLNALIELVKGLLGGLMNILDSSISKEALKFSSGGTIVTGPLTAVMKYLSILGVGLTIMYFLIDFSQKVTLEGRDINFKSVLGPFLKLFVAVLLISHGADIMQGAINVNNDLIDAVADTTVSGLASTTVTVGSITVGEAGLSDAGAIISSIKKSKVQEAAQEAYDKIAASDNPMAKYIGIIVVSILKFVGEGKFFVLLVAVLGGLISWILNTILSLIWWWKAIQYKIEFVFRVGYAPVAFADIYNGLSSASIRYIKGFIALGLYGVALIALPKVSSAIAYEVLISSSFGMVNIWECFVGLIQLAFIAPFAAITAASAVKTVAREAMGA